MDGFSWTSAGIKNARKLMAFSLPEVLITLGVIGVVAALTLPQMIANHQKMITITKLKKTYSVLNQLIKLSEIDNGSFADWDSSQSLGSLNYYQEYWKPYLRQSKFCNNKNDCGYKDGNWKNIGGGGLPQVGLTSNGNGRLLFSIGEAVILIPQPSNGNNGNGNNGNGNGNNGNNGNGNGNNGNTGNGQKKSNDDIGEDFFYIDINGGKPPNIVGKDVFMFSVSPQGGVFPFCYTLSPQEVNNYCNKNTKSSDANCCMAKIIQDGWQFKSDYPW